MKYITMGVLTAAMSVLSGCAGLHTTPPPDEEIRGKHWGRSATLKPVPRPTGELTLGDVVRAIRQGSPALRVAKQNIRIAEATVKQAGALPNPEFEVEFDEFGGTGELSGRDALVTTYAFTQEIPLGGKRRQQIRFAQHELLIARLELAETTLELETEARRSFLSVHVAQERLDLARSALELVKQDYGAVQKKVDSGDVSPVERSKAKVELASAKVDVLQAERELFSSREALAALWGSRKAAFSGVKSGEFKGPVVPSVADARNMLQTSPAARILAANVVRAELELALGKAEAWPDLAVTGGVSRSRENDEHAYLFGISLPLPLFNRNQGAIKAAAAGIAKAKSERQMGLLELDRELAEIHAKLSTMKEEIDFFNKEIVPAAEESYKAVMLGFKAGEQEFLDVLDAQRTLVEMKQTDLVLRAEVQELLIELHGIVGEQAGNPRTPQ